MVRILDNGKRTRRSDARARGESLEQRELLAQAELQGRIGEYPAAPQLTVHTAWDIGQKRLHRDLVLPASGEDAFASSATPELPQRMRWGGGELHKLYKANGWKRKGAIDYVPHDARAD